MCKSLRIVKISNANKFQDGIFIHWCQVGACPLRCVCYCDSLCVFFCVVWREYGVGSDSVRRVSCVCMVEKGPVHHWQFAHHPKHDISPSMSCTMLAQSCSITIFVLYKWGLRFTWIWIIIVSEAKACVPIVGTVFSTGQAGCLTTKLKSSFYLHCRMRKNVG